MSTIITLRPKAAPIAILVIATALMWVLGFIVIVQHPLRYEGYAAVGLAGWIVGYIGTERIEIEDGKIRLYRFFMRRAQENIENVVMRKSLVGIPPVLKGMKFVRKDDHRTIGELISSNYSSDDLDKLKRCLHN